MKNIMTPLNLINAYRIGRRVGLQKYARKLSGKIVGNKAQKKIDLKILFLKFLCLALLPFPTLIPAAEVSKTAETHAFSIYGIVSYRCYAGTATEKNVDSRTKVPCDSKTTKAVLFNERINLKIDVEPNPENSKDLVGSWQKSVAFSGRNFIVAVSLFKDVVAKSSEVYRLRVVAYDDELTNRQTAVFANAKSIKNLNALMLNYTSQGQPEEIDFNLTVEPAK